MLLGGNRMKRLILLMLCLLLGVLLVAGCSTKNSTNANQKLEMLKKQIEISNIHQEGSQIVGLLKNNSKSRLRHVDIRYYFYDKSNNQVESSLKILTDVEPNSTAKFLIHVYRGADTYKIGNVEIAGADGYDDDINTAKPLKINAQSSPVKISPY